MARVKSDLENEIVEIFKKNTPKGREDEVAGVTRGVLPEYFRQLATGNWSEKHPTTGYLQREENKDHASSFISGFLWAMDAAGLVSNEKREEMQKQLSALRFPKHSDAYYEEAAQEAINQQIEKIKCQRCQNYQPYEPSAGLREGCTADELYADEDCQEIIPEVNKEITAYMQKLGEGCPYFIEAAAGARKKK